MDSYFVCFCFSSYRFITRYNDEPNTSFPESKHLLCSESSSDLVKSELSNSNVSVEAAANGVRSQFSFFWNRRDHIILFLNNILCTYGIVLGHCSPLKEVSPGKVLNGRLFSKPVTSAKSSPKSISSPPTKYRLDVPRRDKPLAAMVDSLASKFEKCSKIAPPKSVAPDDKVTVFEMFFFFCRFSN